LTASTAQDPSHPFAGGLRIAHHPAGERVLVRVEGELEMANVAAARRALDEALDCGPAPLVIDLRGLDFVDSTGLHVLVQLHQRCTATGRTLHLLVSDGPVRRTLEVSGVLGVFGDDAQTAVAA
jgi:anti-sigma B factor antagonist